MKKKKKNKNRSYSVLALILILQPIAVQSVKRAPSQTEQRNKIIKQLNDSFKSLTKRLDCTIHHTCTPEQRKQIRRAAIAIIALVGTAVALYTGKHLMKPGVSLPGRSYEEQQEEILTKKKLLDTLMQNPTIDQDKMIKAAYYRAARMSPSAPARTIAELAGAIKRASEIQEYQQKLHTVEQRDSGSFSKCDQSNLMYNIIAAEDAAAQGNYTLALELISLAENIINRNKH